MTCFDLMVTDNKYEKMRNYFYTGGRLLFNRFQNPIFSNQSIFHQ